MAFQFAQSVATLPPLCWVSALTVVVVASACGGRTAAGIGLNGALPADAGADATQCPSDVIFLALRGVKSGDYDTFRLATFKPATGTVTVLGQISCANGASPVSGLAVDRTGAIYMDVAEWRIQRLDPATFECESPLPPQDLPGPISTNPIGYQPLGIAFVGAASGDLMYASFAGIQSLVTVDLDGGAVQATPDRNALQLAGTYGRLYAAESPAIENTQPVVELEPATGAVVKTYSLPGLFNAFTPIAFWNGDIYSFPVDSSIQRFRPSDGTQVTVATVEGSVVGASAAPCPPSP